MNLQLEIIDELQGKAEVLIERLMDAKEFASEKGFKKSSHELSSLVKSSIIDLNITIFKNKDKSECIDRVTLLNELKSILFEIDGITEEERCVKTRKRPIVMSRQIVMAVYHRALRPVISLTEAGSLYGKDHATVINACKVIRNLRDTDKRFKDDYQNIWDWAFKQDPDFTLYDKD